MRCQLGPLCSINLTRLRSVVQPSEVKILVIAGLNHWETGSLGRGSLVVFAEKSRK